MTLLELVVAIAVLGTMVLTFGTVVSQSRALVVSAAARMRANATFAGIGNVIRGDFRRICKGGFLWVRQPSGGTPRVFLTAGGPSPSLTGGKTGTACIIGFGVCPDSTSTNSILWRVGLILRKPDSGPPEGGEDVWDSDLTEVERLTRDQVADMCNGNLDNEVPANLPGSPQTYADVEKLWKLLAGNIAPGTLSIDWTDGSTDDSGNLKWYGPGHPKGGNDNGIEDTSDGYQALWTHHNQANWPAAIKIRFDLNDPTLPTTQYEVICNLER
jgi:hypothetical protein